MNGGEFVFNLNGSWEDNLATLATHLESLDPRCAEFLEGNFDRFLNGDDANARRDFNQRILAALDVAADVEIASMGQP
jgi:hypothetical protein